ncbi:MAG: epoxyqueuosine reductase [Bacillota bacterium]
MKLRKSAVNAGAVLVGFADLSQLPQRPRQFMICGVSVAVALDPEIVAGIGDGPSLAYVEEYERVNDLLATLSRRVAGVLRSGGYRAVPLPPTGMDFDSETLSTPLPHKTVATRAGLGWIGKNALLITEEYGSAVRLGTILTDASLETGQAVDHSRCESCTLCVKKCPAAAPTGENWSVGRGREDLLDAHACNAFAERQSAFLGSAHTICGRCIPPCPWTQRYLRSSR